jgi:predicted phosphoribosyltransferase
MGAVASGGVRVLNDAVVHELRIPSDAIDAVAQRELAELRRRELAYRGDTAMPDVAGRTVIVVDDGLATGTTMQAALAALRELSPARLVVAVPVAPPEVCEKLRRQADEVVCGATPEPFLAVGVWYADFAQTTDDEVRALLANARMGSR